MVSLLINPIDVDFESLLVAAQELDRRGAPRYPFFTNVTLRPLSKPGAVVSAFSREISTSGFGFLHATPIVKGENYEVDIEIEAFHARKPVCVLWCRVIGEGWYLSGCKFA
jgi:hypothetical protein